MTSEDKLSDVLSEFARTMVTNFPIQGILDRLVQRIVEILPITAAGVTLISQGLDPRYVAASNGSALRFEQLQTELDEGPCLAAYRSGDAIAVADLRNDGRFPTFAPRAVEAGLTGVFTFPLRHEDAPLGALDLYRETPGGLLSDDEMRTAQTLADVAAAYLINAQARTDLQDSSDRSRDAAVHDALTDLPNRVLMLERLDHAFQRSHRSGKTSAVFFVDLDNFKRVNDTYGHRVGDELLIAVAERLAGALRPGDTLARLAGDEFVVLCEDLDEDSQADVIAVRIEAALARPFVLSPGEVKIAASIGIAFSGRGNDAPDEFLHAADLAMYRTKHSAGDERHVLDLGELHFAEHQSGLARALPGAARRGELHLEYQPIVNTSNGTLIGVEALLRWRHPTRGPVPPAVFIPFAEHSDQIVAIGRWVLEQAWRERHHWQTEGKGISIAVNVSARQLMSAGFVDSVAAVLHATPEDPGLLTLEVTESIFVRDRGRARIVLGELKRLGVKLALDDFGTGYSSLSYLTNLPFDIVKVDRTFVADLREDPASRTVITAIIELAHSLGMTVVSEGVETTAQHDQLTRLGSDSCQGFYFARPMPASDLHTIIRHAVLLRTASIFPKPLKVRARGAR